MANILWDESGYVKVADLPTLYHVLVTPVFTCFFCFLLNNIVYKQLVLGSKSSHGSTVVNQ